MNLTSIEAPGDVYYFWIAGELRECPVAWWDVMLGPKPPHEWAKCDGCTCSPDEYMNYQLWPACRVHDWAYSSEGPDIPRIVADLILRINLWRLLRAQECPWYRAAYVAGIYHAGVTLGGRFAGFKREK